MTKAKTIDYKKEFEYFKKTEFPNIWVLKEVNFKTVREVVLYAYEQGKKDASILSDAKILEAKRELLEKVLKSIERVIGIEIPNDKDNIWKIKYWVEQELNKLKKASEWKRLNL